MSELLCISEGCEYELITDNNILFQNILKNMNIEGQKFIYCCPLHKMYHICNHKYQRDCVLVDGKCYFSKNIKTPSNAVKSEGRGHVIKIKPSLKTPTVMKLLHKFNRYNFIAQLDACLKQSKIAIEPKRFNSIVQNLHKYITNYICTKCNKQHTNLERCLERLDFLMESIFYSFIDRKIPTTFTRNKTFKEINILISRDLNCLEKDLSQEYDNTFQPEDLYFIQRRQRNTIWKF